MLPLVAHQNSSCCETSMDLEVVLPTLPADGLLADVLARHGLADTTWHLTSSSEVPTSLLHAASERYRGHSGNKVSCDL